MTQSILIADDELHIRALLEQTLEDLEDEGVDLLTASNGQEALDIIQTEKPNLVF
ncbi:MAG: response regulator, partial [Cyanobacteria bacterium J06627_28]